MKNMEKDKPVSSHTETRAIPTVPVTDTHTPGPWAWTDKGTQLLGESDQQIHAQVLCIDLPEFISDEDKHLIAAAPDLLEACKELREAAAAILRVMSMYPSDIAKAWGDEIRRIGIRDGFGVRAQNAIAKAEGRP